MKLSRYDFEDLLAIVKGDATIEEIANKYNVPCDYIHKECNKRGIYLTKKSVKVTRTYKYVTEITTYDSVYQCALALKVDSATIKKAISGQHVKKLGRYKIEYVEKEEYIDEQTGQRYNIKRCGGESSSESLGARGKEEDC